MFEGTIPNLDLCQTREYLSKSWEYALRKHVVGGVLLERAGGGLEEVDDLLVLLVAGAVAGNVKGGRAGRVLGELVRPEDVVRLALTDPVLVH